MKMYKKGDKIMMNRDCFFFKKEVVNNPESMLIWWGLLEKEHPLEVKDIEELDYGIQHITVGNSDFIVSNAWVKEYRGQSIDKGTFS